jgi:hypothetical protein
MTEGNKRTPWWHRHEGLKERRDPATVDAIDAVGLALPHDASAEEVVAALAARGVGFFDCIGLIVLRDVPLRDVKRLVHDHPAFAPTRDDREAFWADLYASVQQLAEAGEIELETPTSQDPDYVRNDLGESDLDGGHNRR